MTENEIATVIDDAALSVHRTLGPGLLESVYEAALAFELRDRGLQVQRQVPIPVRYRSVIFDEGFRADLVVEAKAVVELKSVERIAPVLPLQLLTHLRLADCRLGLLIHFNVELLKDGLKRVVNDLRQ
jgi:GxxExxY protein